MKGGCCTECLIFLILHTTHYILIDIYHIYFDYNSDALISLSFASDAFISDYCHDL